MDLWKVGRMQTSGSYVVVESMIRQQQVMLLELKQLVESLERRGLITSAEQHSLLQLAKRVLPKAPPDLQ